MKDVEEIIAEKQASAKQEAERKALASDVGGRFDNSQSAHSSKMMDEMKRGRDGTRVSNLDEIDAGVDINLNGIETLDVQTVHIHGLDELVVTMLKKMDELIGKFEKITIQTPQVHLPAPHITVEPNITVKPAEVNIPKIEVPKPTVIVKDSNSSKVLEEKEIYKEGVLDGYEEKMSDGSIHKVTGMSVGRRKHEYKG